MVKIVEPYGYCAGVNMALESAKNIKDAYKDRHVVMLGQLVHNNEALEELKDKGIEILYIKGKTYEELLPLVKDDDIVILTAHGHSKSIEDYLNDHHIKFFDMTCPYVKTTHQNMIYSLNQGHEIIYIGKKGHPEAIASLSLSDKVHLYDIEKGIDYSSIKDDSPVIYTQTTFSELDVKRIFNEIHTQFPKAINGKAICFASKMRQDALLSLDKDTDLIYVIGSNFSNNTKTLYLMAKEHFASALVKQIDNEEMVDKLDLVNKEKIAIISGASTPKYISEKVKDKIESLLNK